MSDLAIVGATGLVGAKILELASTRLEKGRIRVWTRRPTDLPIGSTGIVSPSPPVASDDFWQTDVLFIALGTTIGKAGSQEAFRAVDFELALECARRARQSGTTTLALVSAMGADSTSKVFYNRVKGELEEAVGALGFGRLVVARPSLLLGNRTEVRFGEGVFRSVLGPLRSLFPGTIRPVRAEEVASRLLSTSLETGWTGCRILTNRMLLD